MCARLWLFGSSEGAGDVGMLSRCWNLGTTVTVLSAAPQFAAAFQNAFHRACLTDGNAVAAAADDSGCRNATQKHAFLVCVALLSWWAASLHGMLTAEQV